MFPLAAVAVIPTIIFFIALVLGIAIGRQIPREMEPLAVFMRVVSNN